MIEFPRGVDRAVQCLKEKSYKIIDTDNNENNALHIAAYDPEGALHLIQLQLTEGHSVEKKMDRVEAEIEAMEYFSEHSDEPPCQVIFDTISIMVCSDSKALLRYHTNVLNEGE